MCLQRKVLFKVAVDSADIEEGVSSLRTLERIAGSGSLHATPFTPADGMGQ